MNNSEKPFNSALEIALRALFILGANNNQRLSLQRIIYLDYLTIHSEDVAEGPASIHPPLPNRTGEWLLRREVLQKSVGMLIQRELAEVVFEQSGIYYTASPLTLPFLKYFDSPYSKVLMKRAIWASNNFYDMEDSEMASFMNANIAVWAR